MAERERIDVQGELELAMPDGSVYRVRPGPHGKGISLIQAARQEGSGQRGRRPRAGTVKLRQRLARDAQKGNVREAAHYVRWMLKQDPEVELATARQIVYRERRRVLA